MTNFGVMSLHLRGFRTLQAQKLPAITRAVALFLLSFIVLLVLFLILVPWVQTAPGTGTVTSLHPNDRAQNIHALVGGRIKQWYVRDGSIVKEGEPIVEIIDNDTQLLERLAAERNALRDKLEVAQSAARTAKLDVERKKELLKEGLVSERDYEQAKIRYKGLRAEESKARAALNQSETRLSRQQIQTVNAPRDGTIVRIIAGDIATTITAGESIATFVPSGVTPAVELFVDGLNVPLIHPGRKVRLQFEGWPAVQFSGWPATAVGTFGGIVETVDPSIAPNGQFRVIVVQDPQDTPWPDERFLRLGARVKGWVLLDTVNVGYELWRQLNNFPPEDDRNNGKTSP